MKFLNKLFFLILISFFICSNNAFAWTVSPVRFEIKAERGKEYTLSFTVLNESQLFQKRFKVGVDDWVLDERSNFIVKGISQIPIDTKYSASSWVKVTPTQFVTPPGASRRIRFTLKIPNDIPDGGYHTGIFVGEENIEKPPKGTRVVHIKQNTFIGVVVYVKIGQETESVKLTNIKAEETFTKNGFATVTILPEFNNLGNIHSRGILKLKVKPLSTDLMRKIKVKSEDGKTEENFDPDSIQKEIVIEDVVVLRDSMILYPITIPQPIPFNTEWDFELKADFGKKVPLLVGKKHFKVTEVEPQIQENPRKKASPAKSPEETPHTSTSPKN